MQPGLGREHILQSVVAGDGFATNPAYQGSAQQDDDREARHQANHHGAAKNHQRDADRQAQHQQRHAALGRRRHGDHIVQAHHQVGNQNCPDCGHQTAVFPGLALPVILLAQQLHADPEQQRATNNLQIRHGQEFGCDHGQGDSQDHGRS